MLAMQMRIKKSKNHDAAACVCSHTALDMKCFMQQHRLMSQ